MRPALVPPGPLSFLRAHRWPLLVALVVLMGLGTPVVRWWRGAQVTTEVVLRLEAAELAATGRQADVAAPPAVLKQDMTFSADIEVARRPRALIVPMAAVHDPEAITPWVLRIDGHHAMRRAIRLGLRGGGLAEVVEGLAEGDVVVTAPATLVPGVRIHQ